MKKIELIATIITALSINFAKAQTDSEKKTLNFSGYIEAYYVADFNKPVDHTRPFFIYSQNRANEFAINLGFVKSSYQTENVRANLALGVGTYMNANYSTETGILKNIYEANAGVKLSKESNFWLDAGVLPSHIGFESAISKDCWTLTRSILAENSPYFETGARISYTSKNEKWYIAGLVLNGWQKIQMADGNNTPSFGHQITYKPDEKLTLNSSSFIGNDKADKESKMRYFHNFYAIYQVSEKLGFTAGFDIGTEQKFHKSNQYNIWYSPVLICRITPSAKSAIVGRIEYYCDKNGVIIPTETANGFKTLGYSVNYDYKISEKAVWRIEARNLQSKDDIFLNKNNTVFNNNFFITTSIAVSF
jgi:hypothetical protein